MDTYILVRAYVGTYIEMAKFKIYFQQSFNRSLQDFQTTLKVKPLVQGPTIQVNLMQKHEKLIILTKTTYQLTLT